MASHYQTRRPAGPPTTYQVVFAVTCGPRLQRIRQPAGAPARMRKLGQALAFHRDEDEMGAYGIRPPPSRSEWQLGSGGEVGETWCWLLLPQVT